MVDLLRRFTSSLPLNVTQIDFMGGIITGVNRLC